MHAMGVIIKLNTAICREINCINRHNKFTSAMNLYPFTIFKQSLKAGVPSGGKQASPDQMVRKVIILPPTRAHTHTLTEHCPEPAGGP